MINRIISLTFGIVFILVGCLGFVPNPLISATGLFVVNSTHNLLHILAGAAFIVGALILRGRESLVLKAMGIGGVFVTLFNFLSSGEQMLWLVHVNEADRWLHLGLTAVVLISGFTFKDSGKPVGKFNVLNLSDS